MKSFRYRSLLFSLFGGDSHADAQLYAEPDSPKEMLIRVDFTSSIGGEFKCTSEALTDALQSSLGFLVLYQTPKVFDKERWIIELVVKREEALVLIDFKEDFYNAQSSIPFSAMSIYVEALEKWINIPGQELYKSENGFFVGLDISFTERSMYSVYELVD
jgi:hypothetical protein